MPPGIVQGPEAGLSSRTMIKIIGGTYRTRQLHVPPDATTTRPYTQRVKESVFNLLRGWFDDARVLDLFAGVGTVGLEAVSRGAAEVVMIERDRRIAAIANRNIDELGCGDRARVMIGDALGPMAAGAAPSPVDVMFVDPPYPMMQDEATRSLIEEQLTRLRPVMAESSFLILRSPFDPDEVNHDLKGYLGPEHHRYGPAMHVLLYQPDFSVDLTEDAP